MVSGKEKERKMPRGAAIAVLQGPSNIPKVTRMTTSFPFYMKMTGLLKSKKTYALGCFFLGRYVSQLNPFAPSLLRLWYVWKRGR